MPNQNIGEVIAESQDLTFQKRKEEGVDSSMSLFRYLLSGTGLVPPWWSEKRDAKLREFWKEGDHLSGAIYNMTSKMTAIPFKIVPDNPSNRTHVEQAKFMEEVLLYGSEYGEGWQSFYNKLIEDLLTQDNGCFAEIIGRGRKDGPIEGAPVSVAHLDASKCQRTGDSEWPIIYTDYDGKRRKIHYTRVLFGSQMPSPKQDMFGVGFCAVSRCINVAQTLMDILIYKMEKLGSRPHRGILVTGGGLDPDEVADAFGQAEVAMDTQGLSRYAKMVVIGSVSLPDARLDKIELSSLPEGFNEETSITYGMATIALALGVDARELFPAMGAGATRADALLQHIKQRGKGPGQIIGFIEQLFNFKFLPPHLKFQFDQQDDAEDRQSADIAQVRSQARERDIIAGTLTVRAARQRMLTNREISEEQFANMELDDGRLPDGSSIMSMLYTDDPLVRPLLQFSVENPDDIMANDAESMLEEISTNLSKVHQAQAKTRSYPARQVLQQAEAVLENLEKDYTNQQKKDVFLFGAEEDMFDAETGEAEGDANQPPKTMRGDRQQTKNPAAPNQQQELSTGNTNVPAPADDEKALNDAIQNAIYRVNEALGSSGNGGEFSPIIDTKGIEGTIEYNGVEQELVIPNNPFEENSMANGIFNRKNKKGKSQDVNVPLPMMTSGPVFQPVIKLTIPEQKTPNVNVSVDTTTLNQQLANVIKEAQAGRMDDVDLKEVIKALSNVVTTLEAKQAPAPIVNVNVPEQPAPRVEVNPVLDIPETSEVTDVVHDQNGRVVRMIKTITKLVKGE